MGVMNQERKIMDQRFNLRWDEFENCADVTLVCDEDRQIKAHKVVLSAVSPFFRKILKRNPHQHPLIYLNGLSFDHLQSMISFIYIGQTEVAEIDFEKFMESSKQLQIKGLVQSAPEEFDTEKIEVKDEFRNDFLIKVDSGKFNEKKFM